MYISDVIVPVPAGTGPPGYDVGRRFQGAHVSKSTKEPRHGKDGPILVRFNKSLVAAYTQKVDTRPILIVNFPKIWKPKIL